MMETPNDNQIDQLLRRLGRDDRSLPVTGNGHGQEAVHLDADEMNAFAANALPAAARMRYVDHLADCADCRRIVTGLAVAVNPSLVTGAGAALAAPASSSIWERMASWIKPPTLRFAGPVVAVLCVAVIMGLVLRTRYGNQMLSGPETGRTNDVRKQSPVAPAPPANNGSGGTVTSNGPVSSGSPQPTLSNGPVAGKPAPPAVAPDVADKPSESPLIAKTPSVLAPPAPAPIQPKDSDDGVEKTKVATEERENKSTDEVTQTDSTVAGERPEGKLEDQKQDGGDANTTTLSSQDRRGSYPAPAKKTGGMGSASGGPMRSRVQEQSSNQTDDKDAGRRDSNNLVVNGSDRSGANGKAASKPAKESAPATTMASNSAPAPATRSVSGRQFRRQGNVWVDTGYTPGYGVTDVRRGSEQYRALIADEPGLRAFADQLGGEVIVVWKGHAYRIK
jgi:hypothetical protein